MKNYCEELCNIIENEKFVRWEETAVSYCRLMTSKLSDRRKVIFIYDESNSILLLHYCVRYFESHGMCVEQTMKVNLDHGIYDTDNLQRFYEMAMSGEYLVIKLFGIRTRRKIKLFGQNLISYRNIKFYKMLDSIDKIAVRFSAPFWRLRGQEIYDYVSANMDSVKGIMDLLADVKSKETLLEIVRVAASNDVYRLEQGTMTSKYWDCYKHLQEESYINCGSANGDTILSYLNNGYSFEKIYAYEGGTAEFHALQENMQRLPSDIQQKLVLRNEFIGVHEQKNNFNNIFADKNVTLINMDIEGAEMGVLKGAHLLIKEKRPVLAIAAYHKATDICDIPNFVRGNADGYNFYLRKYYGYEPNALNEYVYYAVPKERCE